MVVGGNQLVMMNKRRFCTAFEPFSGSLHTLENSCDIPRASLSVLGCSLRVDRPLPWKLAGRERLRQKPRRGIQGTLLLMLRTLYEKKKRVGRF